MLTFLISQTDLRGNKTSEKISWSINHSQQECDQEVTAMQLHLIVFNKKNGVDRNLTQE